MCNCNHCRWENVTKKLKLDATGSDHLAQTLGFDDRFSAPGGYWGPNTYQTIVNLEGPHGYAIYKAMLIQRGLK